jgi:uncharacterized protein (DUF1501 family)
MKRRKFIQNSALASSAFLIPGFIKQFEAPKLYQSRSGKNLVVVQLSGGNDGLNTIVPFSNDLYYNARPGIGIKSSEVIRISDELGFHPSLKPIQKWMKEGFMSIVNGVGYPNPDRSHFRSMDIWQTASQSDEYLSTGWLGRYLDSNCAGCESPHHALEIGNSLSLSLKGKKRNGFALSNPKQLNKAASNPFLNRIAKEQTGNGNIAYLYKTLIDTQQSASYIFEKSKTTKSRIKYPSNGFAKQLKLIAELMTADLDTKIYYAELNGFDTHANQVNTQQRLLKNLGEGLNAFLEDLKSNKLLDDTLVMVFSEFGRRVKQNASNGTDHGTANNVWLISGELNKKGIYNPLPSLSDLDQGDLKFSIDFKNIYSELLEKQLGAQAELILGKSFPSLGII